MGGKKLKLGDCTVSVNGGPEAELDSPAAKKVIEAFVKQNMDAGLPLIVQRSYLAAVSKIRGVLSSNWVGAWEAYKMQRRDLADGEALKFGITVKVVLEPGQNGDVMVSAKLAYGTKHADETPTSTVTDQPELDM
jgi:hypothetical protein